MATRFGVAILARAGTPFARARERWQHSRKMRTPCPPRGPLAALVLTVLLTVLSDRPARANEESSWAFIGFSVDGAYAAVEIFGTHGDGDAPYSMIRVIDTRSNQFTTPPITACAGAGCEGAKAAGASLRDVRAQNRLQAKEALDRHHVDLSLQGERTKLSSRQGALLGQGGPAGVAQEAAPFRWEDAECLLQLYAVPAPSGAERGQPAPRMIDLRLHRAGAELVLQKDKSIPKSRGAGIYAYELDTVITYRTSLLVVLRHTRPSPHGPVVSQMFVTTAAP